MDYGVYASILTDGLMLGVFACDKTCKITFWNQWLETHSGISKKMAVGQELLQIYPTIRTRGLDRYLDLCLGKKRPVFLSPFLHEYLIPIEIWRGHQKIMMLQNTKIYPTFQQNELTGFVGIIEDFTEQIFHEREIFRLNAFLRATHEVNQLIAVFGSEEDLLRQSCSILVHALPHSFIWVGLLRQGRIEPVHCAGIALEKLKKGLQTEESLNGCGSIFQSVLASGEMCTVNWKDYPNQHHCEISCKSFCTVPLKVEGRTEGILCTHSFDQDNFHPAIMELMREVVRDIGIGIAAFRERQKRRDAEKNLEESNRRLFQSLSELKEAQQYIIREERLRAIGRMTTGIAHEFNNALMPVVSYTDLLLEMPKLRENKQKLQDYLQRINVAANEAVQVVQRLVLFYEHHAPDADLKPVHLHRVIHDAVLITQPQWKDEALAKGVCIEICHELQEIPHVVGNEAELREMLVNLLLNAVDSLPKGGRITFRTYARQNEVFLEVEDTGLGMSEETCSCCFEPFFTLKGSSRVALGLPIVHGIVRRHNGMIDVRSKPGEGSRFTMRFPISSQKPDATALPEDKIPALAPLHILLVDDEPAVRECLCECLTPEGHQVTMFADAPSALDAFSPTKFDIVITDKAMPQMNGEELAKAIKQKSPHMPVILLTGFGDLMQAEGIFPECIDLLLSKPISYTELHSAIRRVLPT